MKLLVISDIHGSGYYAEKIKELMESEKPEKLILLGDLYYHGPRNTLSEEYNPMKVAEILNAYADKIIAVRGNCDAEVDEMISSFTIQSEAKIDWEGKRVFLTHGHKHNIEQWPEENFDIMLYGHFHMGFIHKEKGKFFANPGSISLPKNQTKHSYLILEHNTIYLKDISGDIILECELNKGDFEI